VSGKLQASRNERDVNCFSKATPLLHTMNSKMALYILTHGVGLIAFALLTHRVTPGIAWVTLITGLAGGGLCALWGVLGLLGHRRRIGALLTLIPVCLVLITQAVSAWMVRSTGKSESLLLPTLITLMLVASVGMLMYVLHGNRPPEFYLPGTARREGSLSRGKDSHSDAGRHQSK